MRFARCATASRRFGVGPYRIQRLDFRQQIDAEAAECTASARSAALGDRAARPAWRSAPVTAPTDDLGVGSEAASRHRSIVLAVSPRGDGAAIPLRASA